MAAKSKFEEKAPEVLNLLCQGYNYREACELAHIDRSTLTDWMTAKPAFSTEAKRARKEGEQRAAEDVERALLDLAKGFDVEEVRTEYESKMNPTTGVYEPVIKKQVRTKKRIVGSVEAQKFYLTNINPEKWKNRQDTAVSGIDLSGLSVEHVQASPEDVRFPTSEAEVDGFTGE